MDIKKTDLINVTKPTTNEPPTNNAPPSKFNGASAESYNKMSKYSADISKLNAFGKQINIEELSKKLDDEHNSLNEKIIDFAEQYKKETGKTSDIIPMPRTTYNQKRNRIENIVKEAGVSTTDKIILGILKFKQSKNISNINPYNIILLEMLADDKKIPKENLLKVISENEPIENIQNKITLYKKLCQDESLSGKTILDIISVYNEESKDFVETLYQDKEFPNEKIAKALSFGSKGKEIKAKKELYGELSQDETLPKDTLAEILSCVTDSTKEKVKSLYSDSKSGVILAKHIPMLISSGYLIKPEELKKLQSIMGKDKLNNLTEEEIITLFPLSSLYEKSNINEVPFLDKKDALKGLVASGAELFELSDEIKQDFPLIPKNADDYYKILQSLINSFGINITPANSDKIEKFNQSIAQLSKTLGALSDNEFINMEITQEYSKDEFIKDVLSQIKNLSEKEKQKVFDYYGFELHKNPLNKITGYSITGYPKDSDDNLPVNITNADTISAIKNIKSNVIKFSQNNKIQSNNNDVAKLLNDVIDVLPECRTMIGKTQHDTHKYDVMKHSLKVMQKITQDPKFSNLSKSDQRIMLLASLLHDITKQEGKGDKKHAENSSFDAFFIAKKFGLSKDEETKLYTLCKNHEWLQFVNTSEDKKTLTKRLQSVAYDLRQDNILDMVEIFTHADLRAVKYNDDFHDSTHGEIRKTLDGSQRSLGASTDVYIEKIKSMIKELKKSQPILPTTKIPKASTIKKAITTVNDDGSTNIKGVYINDRGLVILRFNEIEDWESIGFAKGSKSTGISAKGLNGCGKECDVDTGNIKFIAHALDYANQLAKFDAFGLLDSDALLSVSYTERPESKYRLFRPQGILLDVDTKNIHGGGNTDAGSGYEKSIKKFKDKYIFGGEREEDRLYIANLVKEATGMSDEEYIEFVRKNENKEFTEIEPKEYQDIIIKAFATINSNIRQGDREYNEMYISNPKGVSAVFAYAMDGEVGDTIDFVNREQERLGFLEKYAIQRNIPMIIFGKD